MSNAAPSSQVILYPLEAESGADAKVQGVVFAGSHRWRCTARRCSSSVVGQHGPRELRQLCAALAAEVGPIRFFDAGDRRLPDAELDECNRTDGNAPPSSPARVSSRFSFLTEAGRYWLVRAGREKLAVPSGWIVSPTEAAPDQESYVSTAAFDKKVQEFPVGGDLIGLRVSSYAISREGSAQAAAGRDIFLIYDPRTNTLADGGIRLGVTKERHRAAGYWTAKAHRFYLQDANADGRMDVGVVMEEIRCQGALEPLFNIGAVRWHVFRDGRWIVDRAHDGVSPASSRANELPLVGLKASPVEFVRARCAAG